MADSILRLKVDSQEYDQKIKRAAEGIQQYAQKCRDAGGTLQYLDDGVLEFVQALGKMDTVATGTKQQLREMSNALATLTQTYRGLTDEEKASTFGQKLAKGIQQLTERAGQAQDAMADVQSSIRNAASDTRLFDQIAQGASVATAGFQGLTGAGKLLGIEMGDDVAVIAKLQAAMAVTNSLTTIQTALQKESALMQGIQSAKTAIATAAQNALAAATGNAALAQKAFNVVAGMNPYLFLATAIGATVTALALFTSSTDDAASAQDRLNQKLDQALTKLKAITSEYELQAYKKSLLGGVGDEEKLRNDYLQGIDRSVALQKERDKLLSANAPGNVHYTPEQLSGRGTYYTKPGGVYDQQFGTQWRTKGATVVSDENKKAAAELDKKIAEERDQWVSAYSKYMAYGEVTQKFETSWQQLTDPKEIKAAISYFTKVADSLDIDESYNQKYDEYMQRVSKLQAMLRKPPKTTTGGGGGGGDTTTTSEKEITETQQLQKNIEALTKEYQQLSDAEKASDFNASAAIELRKSAIRDEIQSNQQRIDELKKFADEAKQLLPKNQEAVFKITVDKDNLDSLQTAISGLKDKAIKVDVEQGRVELPSVPTDDETIKVNVEQGEVDLPNVPEQYTMTITADTSEAMAQVQNLVSDVSDKTVTIRAKVEMETGISGTNESSISAYVKKLQEELDSIDFSAAGSFQKAIDLNSNIIDATTLGNLLKTSIQEGIDLAAAGIDVEGLFDKIASGEGIENADWEKLAKKINELLEKMGLDVRIGIDAVSGNVTTNNGKSKSNKNPLLHTKEDGKTEIKISETLGVLSGGLSNIATGVEQLGIEIPKGMKDVLGGIQTVCTILTGISALVTVISAIQGAKAVPIVGWMLANGGVVPKAAGGYMIPGNNYSGDNIFAGNAWVNSGELVLNRAQQGVLAAELQGSGMQNIKMEAVVSGEQIMLASNNRGLRTGRGELVQSKRVR